jgi:hypothetical protein
MAPHHFARRNKNHYVSETERQSEEKVEQALKTAAAIIAVPFNYLTGKGSPDKD